MNPGGNRNLAQSRWQLLQEAILKKRIPEPKDNPASKRVFQKFSGIIDWTEDPESGKVFVEIKLSHQQHKQNGFQLQDSNLNGFGNLPFILTVYRSRDSGTLDFVDLRGYDKTGRICIWPAEQVLAYWCLKSSNLFEGKTIIEIGGGFHCLAGLALAKFVKAKEVVLTDGDPANLEQIEKGLKATAVFAAKTVSAKRLRWDGFVSLDFEGKFDVVIAADVVYDSCVFEPLVRTVSKLLKAGGQFILFNPTRVEKLKQLIDAANKSELFRKIHATEDYDTQINGFVKGLETSDRSFNKDWHYPVQVVFHK